MPVSDWNPEKIRRSHVREAARFWRDQASYLPFHNSRSYDVIVDGDHYPPKAISSKAHEFATGRALSPSEFGGAKDGLWHRCLTALKFQIVEKGSDASISYDVAKSFKLSRKRRLEIIAKAGSSEPKEVKVVVTRFVRSPHVVAERLFLAGGRCEACRKRAPFRRLLDDTPYLEVHHIIPLSHGGFDTVENTEALCPNCHSKVHDELRIERQLE